MNATRAEVYAAIDSEREYHARLLANRTHKTEVPDIGHELSTLEEIILRARARWYDGQNGAALEFIRKAAGVSVRCMEHHGAMPRSL